MSLESPQLEDGHLKIVNSIAETLARTQLSGYESRVLWFLWRKTYGWSKKTDLISLSQWVDGTWLDKKSVIRTLKRLRARHMIQRYGDEIITNSTYTYEFNKHFGEWRAVAKSSPVTKSSPEVVTKSPPTTERSTTTSKRIFKDIVPIEKIVVRKEPKDLTPAYDVLSYLNLKANHSYRMNPHSVIHIQERLNGGATVQELKLIIDSKVAKWMNDPHMRGSLNNETLFRIGHYSTYLEEAEQWGKQQQQIADPFGMENTDEPKPARSLGELQKMQRDVKNGIGKLNIEEG
jgi:phage replication O-like protein O